MTSISASPMPTPLPAAHAAAASEPLKKGIDYSRFNNIEDSDDEKPEAKTSGATAPAPPVEKLHCHSCHREDMSKPLRCSVCKKAAYCSAKCQKDDWPFHKRACQKPADPKAKKDAAQGVRKPSSNKEPPERSRKEEEVVVDSEENLTWYRHREWKPTQEPKKEFAPVQIEGGAAGAGTAAEAAKPKAGSVWNAAGTWEEKDVTELAKRTLKEKLCGIEPVDAAGGSIVAQDVQTIDGEASKPVVRGKLRHLFDLSFKVPFDFKWSERDGHVSVSGDVAVSDFTNFTFDEGASAAPELKLSMKANTLSLGRRQAVEASAGVGAWPPPPGSLMGNVVVRMKAWAAEYQLAT